jgi:hypothetical protein
MFHCVRATFWHAPTPVDHFSAAAGIASVGRHPVPAGCMQGAELVANVTICAAP